MNWKNKKQHRQGPACRWPHHRCDFPPGVGETFISEATLAVEKHHTSTVTELHKVKSVKSNLFFTIWLFNIAMENCP